MDPFDDGRDAAAATAGEPAGMRSNPLADPEIAPVAMRADMEPAAEVAAVDDGPPPMWFDRSNPFADPQVAAAAVRLARLQAQRTTAAAGEPAASSGQTTEATGATGAIARAHRAVDHLSRDRLDAVERRRRQLARWHANDQAAEQSAGRAAGPDHEIGRGWS